MHEEMTGHLANFAFDIFSKIGGLSLEFLKQEKKKWDNTFYSASKNLIEKYEKRHCKIKVLGMKEAVDLNAVFTDVMLLNDISSARYTSIEELEKAYEENESRNLEAKKVSSCPGIRIANQQQFIMVLGGPGSGKSTFLKKIGLEAFKAKPENINRFIKYGKDVNDEYVAINAMRRALFKEKHKKDKEIEKCLETMDEEFLHKTIPVLIELRRFTLETESLKELIVNEFYQAGFPEPVEFTERALKEGKLLVLLDGLDEINSANYLNAIDSIEEFVDKYDKNRFIISCRIAAFKGGFQNFHNIEIAPFSSEKIKQFIFKWFNSELDKESNTASRCWDTISSAEYKATLELAQTPLLLTLLCLVYHYQQDFPKNRAILYYDAFNVLLKEWAAEKRIIRDPIYKDLTIPLEEMMLSEIAFRSFSKGKLFFRKKEITSLIQEFLSDNLNTPKYLNGDQILEAIAVQQGILVERARHIYSFSHLTFHEYLTARYITDNGLIQQIVKDYLFDPSWREVILLIAGLDRSGADSLLLRISNELKNIEKQSDKVSRLFNWAKNVQASNRTNYPIDSLIFIYIALGIFITQKGHNKLFTNVLLLIREFDFELAKIVGGAFFQDKAFHRYVNKLSSIEAIKYLEELGTLKQSDPFVECLNNKPESFPEVFCKETSLPKTLTEWENDEILVISKYMDAMLYLLQCKKSAIKISKQTWEQVLKDLLLPE